MAGNNYTSANNKLYEDASKKYEDASKKFNDGSAVTEAYHQGQGLANAFAAQAGRNAQTAALNSNMSKGQAALMGAESANNAYGQGLQQGTQMALSGKERGLDAYGKMTDQAITEGQNRWDRAWAPANMALSATQSLLNSYPSDENTKNATMNNEPVSKVDEILKRHQKPSCDFKSLLSKKEEKTDE